MAGEERWAAGARGEELVAESLARRCPDVPILYDRRMPRSRANIDLIAVAGSGVYVVDVKRYRGKVEVRTPPFRESKLRIAGRDETKLIDGLHRQVEVVRAAVAETGHDVAIHGCLCFVAPAGLLADNGLPLLRRLTIRGYPLLVPRALARQLNRSGPLTATRAHLLYAELARHLPQA